MRIGIKAKQIAAVTAIVGLAVVALSAVHVTRLARVVLRESQARGELLANAIFHRAREVVVIAPSDPYAALRSDPGLRAILESSIYGESVTGASILDTQAIVRVSNDPAQEGMPLPPRADMASLVNASALEQLRVIYSQAGRTLDVQRQIVARRRGIWIDSHRRVDGADAAGARRLAPSGRQHRLGVAADRGDRRRAARAVVPAADQRDPQRPDPARQRRVRRHARSPIRTTSSATWGRSSTRSASSCRRTERCSRDRRRTCSRRSNISRTPSRSSTRQASCCSAIPRCSRSCPPTPSAARCEGCFPTATRIGPSSRRRSRRAPRAARCRRATMRC